MPARILAPLVGEPLPIDFVNTRPLRARGVDAPADQLGTVGGLQQWLAMESDRLSYVPITEPLRLAVIDLRAHTGVALDAVVDGAAPPSASIDAINAALRGAPSHAVLRWAGSNGYLEVIRDTGGGEALLAALAESAAEYLASELVAKTRRCEAPDCDLLFSQTHPRRRWCSSTVCGNRTRVSRYYERHKN